MTSDNADLHKIVFKLLDLRKLLKQLSPVFKGNDKI